MPGFAIRGRIECQRRGPGADRHIREHRVERMAEPGTVQRILGLPADRPADSYALRTALLSGSAI